MTPITILTGFLGAGKTTILNQIVEQNPQIKFGLVINEFGEVGIDSELVTTESGEELVELSNGCVCCMVRKDLQDAVLTLVNSGKVDYVIIETSGLAEPVPVAQTFLMDDLEGKVRLDSVLCVLDSENFALNINNYTTAIDQLSFADVIVLNKISLDRPEEIEALKQLVSQTNPEAAIVENYGVVDSSLLIDNGKWSDEKLAGLEKEEHHEHKHEHKEHDHDHHEHHHGHEHDDIDEVLFTTDKVLDPNKLDQWMQTSFPKNAVRAKGFLRLQISGNVGVYIFQMAGAKRTLDPFAPRNDQFDASFSRLVFIGRDLDKTSIISELEKCVVD